MIQLSKIGYDHLDRNWNNQDYSYYDEENKVKLVMDGCGSQEYAEVGNRLLVQYYKSFVPAISEVEENFPVIMEIIFEQLIRMLKLMQPINVDEMLVRNLSFTILASIEKEDKFVVYTCGDGYILLKTLEGNIKILSTGEVTVEEGCEYPKYFVYRYLEHKENLKYYWEDVSFTRWEFSKTQFQNVGVATDGLRFYTELTTQEQQDFIQLLAEGETGPVARGIRKYNDMWRNIHAVAPEEGRIPKPKRAKRIFKDDITIIL